MQSFRTELENPVVEKDILELEKKIRLFKEGNLNEERFRSLRLARGVYGQRQEGVQMIRIKLPFGKVTSNQLNRIADVSDKYSTGKLHITTRQDIQIHYVSLDDTPQLWAELEKDEVTLREACGNTVRNVTASEMAGIDPDEAFDVSPYAEALTQYFLRNPICQEMGRKIKISFSSSDKDAALGYLHDLGFIPKIKLENGEEKRGFKVLLGGGLGSQPRHADEVTSFLPEDEIIPFTEAVLRVFDRYGERTKRLKARLKFLLNDVGLETFLEWVAAEKLALPNPKVAVKIPDPSEIYFVPTLGHFEPVVDEKKYAFWKKTNVIQQKQKGLCAVGVRVKLGDFSTQQAREIAKIIAKYGTSELRFTLRQNFLIRNVPEGLLPNIYNALSAINLALPGYNSLADITACPGTDTCNLGISNSTGIALALEEVLEQEYPQYLSNQDLNIKISGCMNSCGQHMMAHIGFQGMTIKSGKIVAPALQVLLGGVTLGDGKGRFANKVIKIPSKRGPQALRNILNDFEANAQQLSFLDYYDKVGERYFYDLLKPLADTTQLTENELVDWGSTDPFKVEIGIGECAGVVVDLVATLFVESDEKLEAAEGAFANKKWADGIYHAYACFINTAKALLLTENVQSNTQVNVVEKFESVFGDNETFAALGKFGELVFQIKNNPPTEAFAQQYISEAKAFHELVKDFREKQNQLTAVSDEK